MLVIPIVGLNFLFVFLVVIFSAVPWLYYQRTGLKFVLGINLIIQLISLLIWGVILFLLSLGGGDLGPVAILTDYFIFGQFLPVFVIPIITNPVYLLVRKNHKDNFYRVRAIFLAVNLVSFLAFIPPFNVFFIIFYIAFYPAFWIFNPLTFLGLTILEFNKGQIYSPAKTKSTVTICCSAYFFEEIKTLKSKLEEMGFTVFTPNLDGLDTDYNKLDQDEQTTIRNKLINDHLEKIKQSDAVLVANYTKNGQENYIGANTFLEMGFGYVLGKKIFLLNEIPTSQANSTEISGLKPVVLDGDLTKVVI